jgi:ribosome-associated heat shock protein Hsp15
MVAARSSPHRDDDAEPPCQDWQRLDRWLWFTRAAKTRSFAAALIEAGKIRVNRIKVDKPAYRLKTGDIVTSSAREHVAIWKVLAFGKRRGPASEARQLYEDLAPPPPPKPESPDALQMPDAASGQRDPGSGRPTKRDRRQVDRLKGD